MEIVCDVLQVLSEGTQKPTHILYKANLSWQVMTTSVDFLIKKGMVQEEKEGKRTIYTLTDQGRHVLGMYDTLRKMLAGMKDQVASGLVEAGSTKYPPAMETPLAKEPRQKVHYSF